MKEIALKVVGFLALVLAPIKMLMFSVGVLVVCDMILGILKARRNKEPITSEGLKRTVTKTFVYQLAILVAHLVDSELITGMGVLKVVSGLIAITEVKSIFENLHIITGIDFWSAGVSKINTYAKFIPSEKKESDEQAQK